MTIIRPLLVWHDNLGVILSVTAIMITIILSTANSSQDADENRKGIVSPKGGSQIKNKMTIPAARIWVAGVILIVIVALSGTSIYVNERWSIVPNLTGRTYDDAIQALYDSNLNGQLALAKTNSDLANSDSRIVWQSYQGDTIQEVGATISFVIDDCFSLNSAPLFQYAYKDIDIDQTQKLDYKCDYRDAGQQMVEQEREAIENGTPLDYSFVDPHWKVYIDAADIRYEMHTSVWHGIPYTSANTMYSYKTYAGAMSLTLDELVTSSAALLSGVASKPDLIECSILGKLIPISGQDDIILCRIDLPDSPDCNTGTFFLPQTLTCGDYLFYFSIIDSDNQLYEWYHYITIVDNDG